MVFTISKELIRDVIEKRNNENIEINVKIRKEEKYILNTIKMYKRNKWYGFGLYRFVVCAYIAGELEVLFALKNH